MAMVFQSRHKGIVRAREVFQLTGEFVRPFHAMEQVVPVPKDDDEYRRNPWAGIVVASIDDRSEEGYLIAWSQMQMVEVVGKITVRKVALSGVG